MAADRTEAIKALLLQAEEAHGVYEATDLNGIYDQDWARWYGAYSVEHGIGALVRHAVTTDELTAFLANSNAEFQRTERTPAEPWAAYTAKRIAAEL